MDTINEVHVHYYPKGGIFDHSEQCNGRIGFLKGEYKSEKAFDGRDFDDVLEQMRKFLLELKQRVEAA